jgi:hypothetical protein
MRDSVTADLSSKFNEKQLAELTELDPLLVEMGAGKRAYEVRWETYSADLQEANVVDPIGNLIGQGWVMFDTVAKNIGRQRASVDQLSTLLASPFSEACKFLLDRAQERRLEAIVAAYSAQSKKEFADTFHTPLVKGAGVTRTMNANDVRKARSDLGSWRSELLTSAIFQTVQSPLRPGLQAFANRLGDIELERQIEAQGSKVTVKIPPFGAGNAGAGRWRKVTMGGGVYNIGDNSTAVGSYRFGDTFHASFVNFFYNPTGLPAEYAEYNESIDALLKRNASSIYVKDANVTIGVHVEGTDPRTLKRPEKSYILEPLH